MAVIATASIFYLLGCFAIAALGKVTDFAAFVATVREILPFATRRIVSLVAATVIAIEGAIALLLVCGVAAGSSTIGKIAAALALALAIAFSMVIAIVLARGRRIACNCFGEQDAGITPLSLAGPSLIGLASFAILLGGTWPGTLAAWIASAAAGGYLLAGHRFWSQSVGPPNRFRRG